MPGATEVQSEEGRANSRAKKPGRASRMNKASDLRRNSMHILDGSVSALIQLEIAGNRGVKSGGELWREDEFHGETGSEAKIRELAQAEGTSVEEYLEHLVKAVQAASHELEEMALKGIESGPA